MRDCIHWSDSRCQIGRYGGRPSMGTCQICTDRNEVDAQVIQIREPNVPPRLAPMVAWRVAANTQVCETCNHFAGVNPDLTIKCRKCGCNELGPWNSDNCPLGLWRHAKRAWPATGLKFRSPGGQMVPLTGMLAGQHAFITCPGPSLRRMHGGLEALAEPGLLSMGLNNSVKVIRPNLWCAFDWNKNDRFLPNIWRDPTIMKFYDSQKLESIGQPHPNTWGYIQIQPWQWWRYFSEERIRWGNNVLVIAIRILYDLGIRVVYLLGADFRMDVARPYAFDERVRPDHVRCNNTSYEQLNQRFAVLRPLLEHHGLTVLNCTEGSNLTAFDYMDYDDAIEQALANAAVDTEEFTLGRYGGRPYTGSGKDLGDTDHALLGSDTETGPTRTATGRAEQQHDLLDTHAT